MKMAWICSLTACALGALLIGCSSQRGLPKDDGPDADVSGGGSDGPLAMKGDGGGDLIPEPGVDEACVAIGDKTCSTGKRVLICSADKKWVVQASCSAEQGCVKGACTACEPGIAADKCDGNRVIACGTEGRWQEKTLCPNGCETATAACKTCTPNTEKSCAPNGGAIEKCDETGTRWVADSTCAAPSDGIGQCLDSKCGGFTCKPGFQKCGEACRVECPGIMGLGELLGGTFNSEASDISYDGDVIVGKSEAFQETLPFKWTKAKGMEALGTLSTGTFRFMTAVSEDGLVAVGQDESKQDRKLRAVGWKPDAFLIDPNLSKSWIVSAVTPMGGHFLLSGDMGIYRQPAGGVPQLVLSFMGRPIGISNDGSVVAATAFNSSCAQTNVGNPPEIAAGKCFAGGALSSDGKVLATGVSQPGEVLLWKVGSSSIERFSAPSGVPFLSVTDVSHDASVVVGIASYPQVDGLAKEAMVWDRANGVRLLPKVLREAGVSLVGWSGLGSYPVKISGNGKVVTTTATNSKGDLEAVRIVLP